MHAISFGLLLLAPLLATDVQAEKSKSLIGRQIPAFELHDYLGAIHKSDEWSDKKAIVVVFRLDEEEEEEGPRLAEMAARYEDKGVAFVGIDSNAQDSLADIGHYARTHKIAFPILKDPGNTVADHALAPSGRPMRSCSMASRTIRYYRGMIDNQYGVGYTRPTSTSNYVTDALDRAAGRQKAVTRAATEPAGCYIGCAQRATEQGGAVTYSKHVAPIFNQHCVALPSHRARSGRFR